MNTENLNKLVERNINHIKSSLASKGQEYSNDNDRLINFKRAAKIDNTIPEAALWGFMLKHYTSLTCIKDEILFNNKYPDLEVFREKTGDMINYLILLEALIVEHNEVSSLN